MQKVHAMLITITKENKSYGGGYEALGSQCSNAHPPSSCLVSLNEWIATDMASRKKKWIQATRKMIALIFLNSLFGTRRNYEVCMMDDKRKRRDIVIITGRMDGTPCRDSLKTRESRVAKEYHPIFPDSPKNTSHSAFIHPLQEKFAYKWENRPKGKRHEIQFREWWQKQE